MTPAPPGLLLAAPAAAVVVLVAVAVALLRHPPPEKGTAAATVRPRPLPPRALAAAAARWGPPLRRRLPADLLDRVRRRLLAAGRPGTALDEWCGRLAVFTVLGLAVGAWVGLAGGSPVVALLFVVWGAAHALIVVVLDGRTRQAEIERSLPELVDVLAVLVRGGLTLRPALARVSETFPGPAAEEIAHVLRRLELGSTTRQAFVELRERNPTNAVGRFVGVVLQADALGTPLATALVTLAEDARSRAAHEAKRAAARAAGSVALIAVALMMPAALILSFAVPFFQPGGIGSLF